MDAPPLFANDEDVRLRVDARVGGIGYGAHLVAGLQVGVTKQKDSGVCQVLQWRKTRVEDSANGGGGMNRKGQRKNGQIIQVLVIYFPFPPPPGIPVVGRPFPSPFCLS